MQKMKLVLVGNRMAGVRAVPELGALAVIALAAVALVARRRGQ